MPIVSVVIPAYNHASFLLLALKSVFAQSYPHYEVIVVNDGSPDNTHNSMMSLAEAGRIRYFLQQNAGQGAARNRGIEAARGRYIALLDDDDLWPRDRLATLVQAMEQDPSAVLVYGPAALIDAEGRALSAETMARLPFALPENEPSGDVYSRFLERNYILSPGQTMVRFTALRALDEPPFDTALRGVDDYDFYLRLAKRGTFRFLSETALFYRVHPGNASRNEAQMHLNEMALFRKHRLRAKDDPAERAKIVEAWKARREMLSRYWVATTIQAAKRGRFKEAKERLTTLWRLQR